MLLREDLPRQTIDSDDLGSDELVTANTGKDLAPDDPPEGSGEEDAEGDDNVEPVWEGGVGSVAGGGRNKRSGDEEAVGEEEKDLEEGKKDVSLRTGRR
jgi:hypothetical protein